MDAMSRSAAVARLRHRDAVVVQAEPPTPPPPPPAPDPARRYLAVWFPFLSSDRLVRASSSPADDAPCVFVERQRGTLRITAVDPRAQAQDLSAGMTLAAARAILPDLVAHPAAPAADQDWIERITDLCERYTPRVALDDADGVTIDITDCADAFGGEDALIADLERRLDGWSAQVRHAVAESPEGAQALARFQTMPAASAAAALRRLDIAALRLSEETLVALREAGLKTIGDVALCPSASISAAFGDEVVETLDRLVGDPDGRLQPRRRFPAMLLERRFPVPVTRRRQVLEGIAGLVAQAGTTLAARHRGGRRFAVRLFRDDGVVRDVAIVSAVPIRDPETIMRLFRDQVAALYRAHDAGGGYDLLRFVVERTEPLAPTQFLLEGGANGSDAAGIADDRPLPRDAPAPRARMRDGAIARQGALGIVVPEPVASALPDWQPVDPDTPPVQPIHLFDPPERLQILAELPDGPPHRFRWRGAQHDLVRIQGPERAIEATRDYFRVEDRRGRRFWIYRAVPSDPGAVDPCWYLHGVLA
jgi:protein ImuB